MNICTIATKNWVDLHLRRWVRLVKESNPGAHLFLFFCDTWPKTVDSVFKEFEKVECVPAAKESRPLWNRIRMSAAKTFGVGEILYCDCDADIMDDLSGLKVVKGDLLYTRTPQMHSAWVNLSQACGYGMPEWEGNNGFLYMRKDFKAEYGKAEKKAHAMKVHQRVAGTMAFNMMLRDAKVGVEIPEDWSALWWRMEMQEQAKVIQYCGDKGQKKRLELEALWRAVQ